MENSIFLVWAYTSERKLISSRLLVCAANVGGAKDKRKRWEFFATLAKHRKVLGVWDELGANDLRKIYEAEGVFGLNGRLDTGSVEIVGDGKWIGEEE